MSGTNEFNREELARYFVFEHVCWYCELFEPNLIKWNSGDSWHHTLGRVGEYHNSILNAAFINNDICHLPNHGKMSKESNAALFLEKNLKILMVQGYEFNDIDNGFIEKHKKLYESILEKHSKVVNT
jgi:hypothetical protein